MSDPDNFLSRWSRRKREAGLRPEKGEEAPPASASEGEVNSGRPISSPAAPSEIPEFDVSKLPPIDSISADTDISVFMQKGVPSALRDAALRRVWSADPAIRDFIGPNENFWDAAGPDGIAGFGDLAPGFDVKRMVAELFGETKPEAADSPDSRGGPATGPENSVGSGQRDMVPKIPEQDPDTTSQRIENAATQQDSPQSQPPKKIVRRHGGAMPQ